MGWVGVFSGAWRILKCIKTIVMERINGEIEFRGS
jgi:hypothetical protein